MKEQIKLTESDLRDIVIESVNKIYGGLDKKQSMIVGMIDYGTCDISLIQPQAETIMDGIRVIFKK